MKGADELKPAQRKVLCYLKEKVGQSCKPPVPSMLEGAPSCAMVSNAAALLMFNYGEEIDNHNIVFRINESPTAGFEKHVGSKCSFRMGWKFSAGNTCPHLTCTSMTTEKVDLDAVLMSMFPGATKQKQGGVTTGFSSMVAALSYCGTLDTYEMTPSSNANSKWAYYPESKDMTKDPGNTWHSFTHQEWALWRFLSTTGRVQVLQTGLTKMPGFPAIDCQGQDINPPFDIPI